MAEPVVDTSVVDPFDSVLFTEERLHQEGHEEGQIKGREQGRVDGFVAGQVQGARLGGEMGFYIGFVDAATNRLPNNSDKVVRALRSLDEMVKGFDFLQISAPNYQTTLSQIRSKFHQILSLLRIDQSVHPFKKQPDHSLRF